MKIFLSAGEPSGDLHGGNLARALKAQVPELNISGFGGPKMMEAGCEILFPLVDYAVVGFSQAIKAIPKFRKLLNQADDFFRQTRPDALVMIDYPGFHWWLASRAKKQGIPVIYYVPPQIWGWASWRVKKMRRLVDLVLCNFPFEETWFKSKGVQAKLIGHPYYDEILRQNLDSQFIANQKAQGGILIGLLPGSRNQEVEKNAPSMIRSAELIHQRHPQTRFLFACFSEAHKKKIECLLLGKELPVQLFIGKTPEIISISELCATVSGSVSLELLCAAKPSTIQYRTGRVMTFLARLLKEVPFITLVNLLAGKMLYPESFGYHCPSSWVADQINHWLDNPQSKFGVINELEDLKEKVVSPGASERGADEILQFINHKKTQAA